MLGDAHAHREALEAVIAAAAARGADQLWSLGDMIGGGPDPERAVTLTREHCAVALLGNHDYGATSADPARFGEPGSPGRRSIELARRRLAEPDVDWLRSRRPAARREGVQCWHGSPRNPVREYVGVSNAGACLAVQRAQLGFVGHTHVPAAWRATAGGGARRVPVHPGEPLDVSTGTWLLNPGAVGAPVPSRLGWWDALADQAPAGAFWLLADLAARTVTWHRAPFDPGPARARARALGLDGSELGPWEQEVPSGTRGVVQSAPAALSRPTSGGLPQPGPSGGKGRLTSRRDGPSSIVPSFGPLGSRNGGWRRR
ncbi:MAG TPA: metallophosphoesterase family protein [Solirubrobacteraceae bacterium]|nr:metallophosphoesterase family protein [Solirubrobacteraceae bacterium]